MDDDEALRLNTLHRFSKKSPRLVLEEHSHCEVPAGCGGVVFQWRNPMAGVPILVEVPFVQIDFPERHDARVEGFVDGVLLQSARADLPFGDHVVAVHLSNLSMGRTYFVVRVTMDVTDEETRTSIQLGVGSADRLRLTYDAPPSDWAKPDFDDSSWATLAPHPLPSSIPQQTRHYTEWAFRNSETFALRQDAREAWVRGRVRFEAPQ